VKTFDAKKQLSQGIALPRIKRRTIYQVINDFGEVHQEFSDEEKAEDYLTELLENLRQIEEDEKGLATTI
jgi:hypothetical protein